MKTYNMNTGLQGKLYCSQHGQINGFYAVKTLDSCYAKYDYYKDELCLERYDCKSCTQTIRAALEISCLPDDVCIQNGNRLNYVDGRWLNLFDQKLKSWENMQG